MYNMVKARPENKPSTVSKVKQCLWTWEIHKYDLYESQFCINTEYS